MTTATQFWAPAAQRIALIVAVIQFAIDTAAVLWIESFLTVVLNYAPVMLLLLVMSLAGLRNGKGSPHMIAGILILFAASGILAARVDLFSPLDHNGLYHLLSMIGTGFLYAGGAHLKTSQTTNTNTIGIAYGRCVRATTQPVAICVKRIVARLAIELNEISGLTGSPMWRNFRPKKEPDAIDSAAGGERTQNKHFVLENGPPNANAKWRSAPVSNTRWSNALVPVPPAGPQQAQHQEQADQRSKLLWRPTDSCHSSFQRRNIFPKSGQALLCFTDRSQTC